MRSLVLFQAFKILSIISFKVLIVISDGKSQSGTSALQTAAQKLRDAGVNVLAVGVGYNINRNELQVISSSASNVFSVSNANYLSTIVKRINEVSCQGLFYFVLETLVHQKFN